MSETRTGSCLCGKVRFTATGALRGVVYCHCGQCRKQTGHFFAATSLPDRNLSVEGSENVTWFSASASARRGFCRFCGSALFWKREGGDRISVLAGAFDAPTGLAEEMHIFVADKGDYYEIAHGLPQFDRSTGSVPVDGD